MATEVWQRGPVSGYEPLLMPVVHSLLQVGEEVDALLASLPEGLLWAEPPGAATIGFHIRHLAGASLRLLTYARGESLTAEQVAAARREATERPTADEVRAEVHAAIERVLDEVRATRVEDVLSERKVGRAGLPSTKLGLLFHIAEHATRHSGQATTTARMLAPARQAP